MVHQEAAAVGAVLRAAADLQPGPGPRRLPPPSTLKQYPDLQSSQIRGKHKLFFMGGSNSMDYFVRPSIRVVRIFFVTFSRLIVLFF